MKNQPSPKRCPKCGQFTVDRANRRCRTPKCAGQGFLFFAGDDAKAAEGPLPWFMWLPNGPRGCGWYRKPFVELMRNW